MIEAANTSETLVNFYQTTRRYKPEDIHLRTHRRENLKSYLYEGYPRICTEDWSSLYEVPSGQVGIKSSYFYSRSIYDDKLLQIICLKL
jgi:hypothetical protein